MMSNDVVVIESEAGETAGITDRLNAEVADLAARIGRGLVQVVDRRRGSVGSGIVWDRAGLIVTNAHVIRRSVCVRLRDGRTLPARLRGADRRLDLALLEIDDRSLEPIPVGDAHALRPGEWVMAMGHPWGVANAMTAGTVISVGAEWDEEFLAGREWILADTHLRPGNSGGPLVDSHGRLVGINTMAMGRDMGIAVPAHVVADFVHALDGH